MNEEEKIIEFIEQEYGNYDNYVRDLLDLYKKEKLNSLSLSEQLNKEKEKNKNSISKDKIKVLLQDVDNTKFINKHVKGMYLYDNLKCLLEE